MQGSKYGGAILGVGNVLQGDDGIGVKLLKYLDACYCFPDHVDLIDGGTAGAGLQSSIYGKEWLIVLDALIVPGNPGEVRVLSGIDLQARPSGMKLSPHEMCFFDLLQFMALEGTGPNELTIVGIIPESTGFGVEVSPAVERAMKTAQNILLTLLEDKMASPVLKNAPEMPDYWWLDTPL